MEQLPPLAAELPPLLPSSANKQSARHWLAVVLSFCLALFLVDAVLSFADDSLILLFGAHALSLIRGLISLVTLLMGLWLYAMMGLTPMIPKRLFLPIPLFFLGSMLGMVTLAIFWYHRVEQIAFAASAVELLLAIGLLYLAANGRAHPTQSSAAAPAASDISPPVQGKRLFAWPLIRNEQLGAKGFSWRNLSVFVLANVFVVLPAVAIYLFVCSAQAVSHFSEGFMALHPGGFTVQVRKYVRDDGKAIQLFPMAHVASASFYRQVSQTFPSNSVILMEGVTDSADLLTNKITYKRMAKSLGLSEQKETFAPSRGEMVRADVDVDQFSASTIDFLNLMMLFHSRGVTAENISKLAQYTPPPGFEKQLFDDLLTKRNEHLLGQIQSNLVTSDNIMVPWGVAHMPGLAREIQKFGFHLSETREYVVIPFGHARDR